MRPTQLDGFVLGLASQKAVKEAGGKAVSAPDAIQDVQFACRRHKRLAVDPRDCTPAMAAGGMYFAQSRREDFDLRVLPDHLVDHPNEGAGIELGFGRYFRSG